MSIHARRLVIACLALWSLAMLVLAVRTGVQHDYIYYLQQWELVRTGVNPWSDTLGFPPNTYGPVHNLLAVPAAAAPLAPKIIMVLVFLAMNLALLSRLLRSGIAHWQIALYAVLIPCNVLTVTVVAVNGDNDVLVAAIVGFALLARLDRRVWWAGALLGAAVLVKYYPLLLLPFLCLDSRRFDLRPAASTLGVVVVGLGASWAVWGSDQLFALTHGVSRLPTVLSPLAAFAAHPDLLGASLAGIVADTNVIWVMVAAMLCVAFAWWRKLTWIQGAALGLFACLVVYKVGHQQFYLSWLVVLAVLAISGGPRSRAQLLAFLPFVAFLEIADLVLNIQVREIATLSLNVGESIGFITGVFALLTAVAVFVAVTRPETERPQAVTLRRF